MYVWSGSIILSTDKVFDKFGHFSRSRNTSQKLLKKAYFQNLLKTMVAVAHKYSANEALTTFILASDSESNDSFGDESSLEISDRYDSEGEP